MIRGRKSDLKQAQVACELGPANAGALKRSWFGYGLVQTGLAPVWALLSVHGKCMHVTRVEADIYVYPYTSRTETATAQPRRPRPASGI